MSGDPVVFLDKDGTIIEDLPYNVDPARVRFAPGARRGLRRLGAAGFGVAIVTNQSGIARGYFGLRDLARLAHHLGRQIEQLGSPVVGFFACPHLPEGVNRYAVECDCRKPAPGLLLRAARYLRVDPASTWMVGDTWMDVLAGRRAGCSTILVGPEHVLAPGLPADRRPDHAVPDLDAAASVILAARAARALAVPA